MEQPPNNERRMERNIEALRADWGEALRNTRERVAGYLGVELSNDIVSIPYELESLTAPALERKSKESSLVVVSSVAGGGKSTVGKILESIGLTRLPRVTTRAPRPGEVFGHDYEFVSREEFDSAQKAGAFAYVKDTYGEGRAIRKSTLDSALRGGQKYYAEGDALAYATIRNSEPSYQSLSYVSMFLIPDSFDTALTRLRGRVQENIEQGADPKVAAGDIEVRIAQSVRYLEESGKHIVAGVYDGYLVNDDLERIRKRLRELFA